MLAEKLHDRLMTIGLPIPLEIILFGTSSRPWMISECNSKGCSTDHAELIRAIEAWCDSRCTTRNGSRHWKDFTMKELSRGIGKSEQEIRDCLRMTMGINLRTWKTDRRVEIAKELLKDWSCCSIAEAARAAGFNDMANFSRQFRRNAGCSPTQWKSRFD